VEVPDLILHALVRQTALSAASKPIWFHTNRFS
jgi:hypothetical protein